MTTPRATVRSVDGQLVLDDPDALAMVTAVAKINCRATLRAHAERVDYFTGRLITRGDDVQKTMIVVIAVDEPRGLGAHLAEILMSGMDWQSYRDRGEAPFARGLATREGIQSMLDDIDADAGAILRAITGEPAVLVVDHGVVAVFRAAEAT